VDGKPPRLISPKEAAEWLHTNTSTLAIWRSTKRYPLPYVKVGRSVYYKAADVLAFLENRTKAR